MAFNAIEQRGFDGSPGDVLGVDNPVPGVTAFFSEMEGVGGCGEVDAELHQFVDVQRSFVDHECHHCFVAKPGSGVEGVGGMELGGVILADGGRNAALSPVGVGGGTLLFGDDGHLGMFCRVQGKIEAGNATADDEYIGFE